MSQTQNKIQSNSNAISNLVKILIDIGTKGNLKEDVLESLTKFVENVEIEQSAELNDLAKNLNITIETGERDEEIALHKVWYVHHDLIDNVRKMLELKYGSSDYLYRGWSFIRCGLFDRISYKHMKFAEAEAIIVLMLGINYSENYWNGYIRSILIAVRDKNGVKTYIDTSMIDELKTLCLGTSR